MCEYCGCQNVEVIADLTAEHDRLRELGRELSAAAGASDLTCARELAGAMRDLLYPHTAVEERGLFPLMAGDFPDQMSALVAEHHVIDDVLADVAAASEPVDWQHRVLLVVGQLFDHILKEQDGVFPAAFATLTTSQWDDVGAVRAAVSM